MDIDNPLSATTNPSGQLAQVTHQASQRPVEISLIDLVLAATDASEDEFEVSDGIADLIESGAVSLLSRGRDPMQRCLEPAPALSVLPVLPELSTELRILTTPTALPAPHPLAR